MSLFKKIFGENNKPETLSKADWFYLENLKDLDGIVKISFEKPIVIFKHSTRCSISRFALRQFENEYGIEADKMELYFLDLLEYRNISDAIALRFQVQHQSPQLIVLKDGKAVYHVSHSDIDAGALQQFV
jgi:bacillithiol system protein YtxJ